MNADAFSLVLPVWGDVAELHERLSILIAAYTHSAYALAVAPMWPSWPGTQFSLWPAARNNDPVAADSRQIDLNGTRPAKNYTRSLGTLIDQSLKIVSSQGKYTVVKLIGDQGLLTGKQPLREYTIPTKGIMHLPRRVSPQFARV